MLLREYSSYWNTKVEIWISEIFMTMFTLEINLNTNTSTFTLSPSLRVSPSTSKSLLDVAGMLTTHQSPSLFFSFNRPGQCPQSCLSILLLFAFLKTEAISGHYALSHFSAHRCILWIDFILPNLSFTVFFSIHTCINEFSFSSIDKRSRWILIWLYSLDFIKYLGIGFSMDSCWTTSSQPPYTYTYKENSNDGHMKGKWKLTSVVLKGICVQVCLRNVRYLISNFSIWNKLRNICIYISTYEDIWMCVYVIYWTEIHIAYNHLKVNNLVEFSTFRKLCNYQLYLVPKNFYHSPNKTPQPLSILCLISPYLSPW